MTESLRGRSKVFELLEKEARAARKPERRGSMSLRDGFGSALFARPSKLMRRRVSLLQGATEQHYHIVPSEIGMITLPPEREAIFNHLARIDHSKFPEFVGDILRLVE